MATPAYGLDATLAAKAAAKYDPALEKEVTTWISAVTGVAMEGTVGEWLHDGKVLCQLANAIKPGSVKKINTMNAPFKQRENITYFQKFMRDNGMNESSMFGTDDLYDEKNMGSFITAMNTFGGVLQTHVPEFSGPKLGVAVESHVTDSKRNDHKGKDFVCSSCKCLVLQEWTSWSAWGMDIVECVDCTGKRFERKLDPGPRFSPKLMVHEREKAEMCAKLAEKERENMELRAENERIKQQAAEHMPIEQRRRWWALWRSD